MLKTEVVIAFLFLRVGMNQFSGGASSPNE